MGYTVEFSLTTRFAPELEREANHALRGLLEDKHLYQAAHIDVLAACRAAKPSAPVGSQVADPTEKQLAALTLAVTFSVERPNAVPVSVQPTKAALEVSLYVPTVMAICPRCKELRPFNLVGATTVAPTQKHGRQEQKEDHDILKSTDTFSFAYECQACKGPEDVFLVRRESWKLTLCGRSPIELVAIPSYIPASVRDYYRSAVVASNSGEVLAGLFLLRVLIEQFTRPWSAGDKSLKAADVVETYMGSLPDDFKAHFPSLRSAYEALSAAMHTADASHDLFATVRAQIEEHFDARRLHKLPAPPSVSGNV
jgi:phage FluMu protein Com